MEKRKQNQKEFYNILGGERLRFSDDFENLTANRKWHSITRKSKAMVRKWLSEKCLGRRVLDYCCGTGGVSLRMVRAGAAKVVGIDISDVQIKTAKRRAAEGGLIDRVHFLVMDAENMAFDNNSFDIVYEGSVLHHLELEKAYSEIARVLKPDGKCICFEALGHNPIIHYYRKRTPQLRTEWEVAHILKKKDIEIAKHYFNKVEILGFFHLASIAAVPFRNMPSFILILTALEAVDSILMKLPILKWQAWFVVFVLSK